MFCQLFFLVLSSHLLPTFSLFFKFSPLLLNMLLNCFLNLKYSFPADDTSRVGSWIARLIDLLLVSRSGLMGENPVQVFHYYG